MMSFFDCDWPELHFNGKSPYPKRCYKEGRVVTVTLPEGGGGLHFAQVLPLTTKLHK